MEKVIYLLNYNDRYGHTATIRAYDTKEEAEKAAVYANSADGICSCYDIWCEIVPVVICQNFDESKFKEEYKRGE